MGLLTENRIFKQRNADIGVVTEEDIQNWGYSGVMVRGSGWHGTCGARNPMNAMTRFDFQIPVGKNGDCYDRYLCRMEEMRQSLKIMQASALPSCAHPKGRAMCWRGAS